MTSKTKKLFSALCLAICMLIAFSVTALASESTVEGPASRNVSIGFYKDTTGTYYVKSSDGQRAYGPCRITANGTTATYYFDPGTGYLDKGSIHTVTYNGKKYLVDANGIINTTKGLKYVKSTGKLYCVISSSGVLAVDEAVTITSSSGVNIYCFDKTGVMYVKSGLRTAGGKTYLIKSAKLAGSGYTVGLAQTGWQTYKGKKCYFNSSGVLVTGVVKSGSSIYYSSATEIKTGPFKIGKKEYYADKNGKLVTGWFQRSDKNNRWYYYSKRTGAMYKSTFVKISGNYYYLGKTGKLKTGWYTVDGKRYYGKPTTPNLGARYTGWQTINGKQYYFSSKGRLRTTPGWFRTKSNGTCYLHSRGYALTGWQKIDGCWYYFSTDASTLGRMQTGWIEDNGKRYYLRTSKSGDAPKGSMVSGTTITINNVSYTFDASGALKEDSFTGIATRVEVNRQKNIVTVYSGNTPVRAMYCCTGVDNATPVGTTYIRDKWPTYELNGPSWGFYCMHIWNDILFHSIPYDKKNDHYSMYQNAFNLLGTQASHGCIRLAYADAKWLYNHVKVGTSVIVSDTCATPLTPVSYGIIPIGQTWDPTDDEL